jgi:hypothetical protein
MPSITTIEDAVSAVSVFKSMKLAEAEADRLNTLNADKRSYYVVLASRLKGESRVSD